MRVAAFRKAVKGMKVSSSYSLPAPYGGWNARDSVAQMKEDQALTMSNVFPDTGEVMVRKGYSVFASDIGGSVESIMVYNSPAGTQSMFCAAGTAIYNATAGGVIGAGVQTGLTNARWQSVNFTNSAGDSYLCCFNGADSPRYWNGTTWISITAVSTPAITGLTASTIINATVHKRRLWLVQVNSLKAWYLPVDSVGGAAAALDIGGIAYNGGYIVALGTWTIDAGEGMDDYFCIATSEGQLVVYRGTDPSDATKWVLVGVWDVGQPLGYRCLYKYKSDLLFLSKEGVLPLSALITTGRSDARVSVTDKITQAMASASALYSANYGWDLMYYPEANMLLVNIPAGTNSQQQYAMNTVTGNWGGPFSSLKAVCWALFDGQPYFGSDGYIGRFWDSLDDDGSNIAFNIQQSYSYLGSKGRLKKIKSVRPAILSDGTPSVLMGINVDYEQREIFGSITFSAPSYALWDSGVWDLGLWGGALSLYNDWQTVNAIGTSISIRMKGEVSAIQFRYAAVDVLYENGGVIA